MTATPADYTQSATFRDLRGFTSVVRAKFHNVDQGVTTPSIEGLAFVSAVAALTNAALSGASGPYYLKNAVPPVYGASTPFANVEDTLHLEFAAAGTDQIVRLTIPAPLEALFLTTDKRTVDKTNSLVTTLVDVVTGVANANIYMISPQTSSQVTGLITGYRKRSRNDRRRVSNLTIGKP